MYSSLHNIAIESVASNLSANFRFIIQGQKKERAFCTWKKIWFRLRSNVTISCPSKETTKKPDKIISADLSRIQFYWKIRRLKFSQNFTNDSWPILPQAHEKCLTQANVNLKSNLAHKRTRFWRDIQSGINTKLAVNFTSKKLGAMELDTKCYLVWSRVWYWGMGWHQFRPRTHCSVEAILINWLPW